MNQKLIRAIVVFGVCGFAACKDAVDPGGTPTTIEIVTAAPANGVVNSAVTPGPSFLVKNENGQAMATNVTIAVTSGGGALTGKPAKSNSGTTSIGTWTLGKTAGANTVTVTVGSLTPVAFSVTGNAAAPYKVVEVNPPATLRSGLANAVVTGPIVVAVADTFNNAIAGRVVNFSILLGGGTLTGNSTATTDASGQATAPTWRLGKNADGAGQQRLRASSGTLLPGDISATVQSSYNIVVRFYGPTSMSASQQAIFTNAAQRIMGVIIGDVPDIQLSATPIDFCASGQNPLTEVADDLIIYAQSKTIDGQGGVLGSAGYCYIRSPGPNCASGCANIPIIGHMDFDTADLAFLESIGALQNVITHEMLHVVGIGTAWPTFSLLTGAGGADPRYTGAQGVTGCQATGGTLSCASTVPVENIGSTGTRDSHWRETTFGSELMTGTLNSGTNPFSALSVFSLQDFGYTVNTGDADSYTIAAGSLIAGSNLRVTSPTSPWEIVNHGPVFSIDATGNVRLVRNPK